MRHALATALVIVAAGCAIQLGGHAGLATVPRATGGDYHVAPTWGGQLSTQAHVGPARNDKLLVGLEADARAEGSHGSRWTIGLQLGYTWLPPRRPGGIGLDVHADLGTPIRDSSLLGTWDSYAGATVALRVWLGRSHAQADLNTSHWLLMRIPEVLVYMRGRVHLDVADTDNDVEPRVDAVVGLAFRFLILSDLIE